MRSSVATPPRRRDGQLTITNPSFNAQNITNFGGALHNGPDGRFSSFAGPDFAGPYCGKGIAREANVPGFFPKVFSCQTTNQETGGARVPFRRATTCSWRTA